MFGVRHALQARDLRRSLSLSFNPHQLCWWGLKRFCLLVGVRRVACFWCRVGVPGRVGRVSVLWRVGLSSGGGSETLGGLVPG